MSVGSTFLQVDPVEGGSCNDYDYVCGDPVNAFDLDGRNRTEERTLWTQSMNGWTFRVVLLTRNRADRNNLTRTLQVELTPPRGWTFIRGDVWAAGHSIRRGDSMRGTHHDGAPDATRPTQRRAHTTWTVSGRTDSYFLGVGLESMTVFGVPVGVRGHEFWAHIEPSDFTDDDFRW